MNENDKNKSVRIANFFMCNFLPFIPKNGATSIVKKSF